MAGDDLERARARRLLDGLKRMRAREDASAEAAANRLLRSLRDDLPPESADLPAYSDRELNERSRDNYEVQAAYVTKARRREWRERPAPGAYRRTHVEGISPEAAAVLRRSYVKKVPDLTAAQRMVLMLKGQQITNELLADLRQFPEILTACTLSDWSELEARLRGSVGRGARITEMGLASLLDVSQPAVSHLYERGFGRVLAFARQRDRAELEKEAQHQWETLGRAEWDRFRAEQGLKEDEDPYEWGYGPKTILEELVEYRKDEEESASWYLDDVDEGDIYGALEDLGHRPGNTDDFLD